MFENHLTFGEIKLLVPKQKNVGFRKYKNKANGFSRSEEYYCSRIVT